MRRIFGRAAEKKEEPPPPDISEVSGRVDGRVKVLEDKIRELDRKLIPLKQNIKKSRGATQQRYKKQALQLLKRRKMYDAQLNNLSNQAFNLEQTAFAIETAKDTIESVQAMKASTVALKQHYAEINLDEVEDLHEQMDELMMDQEEMQEVMGRSFGDMADVDEDDLMDELAELDDELEMGLETPANDDYMGILAPAAPTGPVETAVDEFGLPITPGTAPPVAQGIPSGQ